MLVVACHTHGLGTDGNSASPLDRHGLVPLIPLRQSIGHSQQRSESGLENHDEKE